MKLRCCSSLAFLISMERSVTPLAAKTRSVSDSGVMDGQCPDHIRLRMKSGSVSAATDGRAAPMTFLVVGEQVGPEGCAA
jgi:hypothetical protein